MDTTIAYNDSELQNAVLKEVDVIEIETNDFFAEPREMDFVLDSLMVVFDTNNSDKVCHIINLSGDMIASFGMKGRSATEVVQAGGITVSEGRDSVYIFDNMIQKLVGFDIKKVLAGDEDCANIINVSQSAEAGDVETNRFWEIKKLNRHTFIGLAGEQTRFVLLDSTQVASIYNDYPNVDPDEECNWSIWSNLSHFSPSPDGKWVVSTTGIGALIEILNVDKGKMESVNLKAYYEPKYDLAQGARPKCVIGGKDTIFGFSCLYTSYNFFVTSLYGKDMQYANKLLFYDYQGHLRKMVNVSETIKPITAVCSSSNGDTYFFGKTENGKSELYKCHIDI